MKCPESRPKYRKFLFCMAGIAFVILFGTLAFEITSDIVDIKYSHQVFVIMNIPWVVLMMIWGVLSLNEDMRDVEIHFNKN